MLGCICTMSAMARNLNTVITSKAQDVVGDVYIIVVCLHVLYTECQ